MRAEGVSVADTGFGLRSRMVGYREMANALRVLAMDAVEQAQSGHPGMPMGMADVAAVLYARHLKFDPDHHDQWPDRDRLVLSAGHGSMLLYALLHLTGYAGMSIDELKRFRQFGSKTPGHPEFGHTPGVETTTGPLGQGLATAVGMALAERLLAARYGTELVDHQTYVIAGDGCLMEGISHEAISLAGHLRLNKLIVLYDDNQISIDGPTSLSCSDDPLERFVAAGWSVRRIDGHHFGEIDEALDSARMCHRPSLIACRTTIGFGAPTKAGTHGVHGSPLGATEIEAARRQLGWSAAPFEIPELIRRAWRATAVRGAEAYAVWSARLQSTAPEIKRQYLSETRGELSPALGAALLEAKRKAGSSPQATRISSQKTLEALAAVQPNLLGGSADLTGSNNTKTAGMKAVTADDFNGRYLHYGVREHAMAAAMNGLALHGGFIPYGGTFLVFSDYCRPAMRLSALMRQRVIYVMTHDSIGLGEDGPTHQPVEHLAALRAIPNLQVIRPADAVETVEAWDIALRSAHTPSVLCLSRQNLPLLRSHFSESNYSARGGYVLRHAAEPCRGTLIASGSEVSIAIEAAQRLQQEGIEVAVVSMPCLELFAQQSAEYRERVLGSGPRMVIEAGVRQGWDRWIGSQGCFVGMHGFGASAPAAELFEHFGITVDRVVAIAREHVKAMKTHAENLHGITA